MCIILRCLYDFVTFEDGTVSIKAGPFHKLLSDQMENGQPLEVEVLKFAASSGGGLEIDRFGGQLLFLFGSKKGSSPTWPA